MFSLTTLAAAILSSSSLVLATPTTPAARDDPHIVDFRTYGAPGCFEANQGVYTYTQSNLDICYQFGIHGEEPVGSIFVVDIVDGCSGMFASSTPPPLQPSSLFRPLKKNIFPPISCDCPYNNN